MACTEVRLLLNGESDVKKDKDYLQDVKSKVIVNHPRGGQFSEKIKLCNIF